VPRRRGAGVAKFRRSDCVFGRGAGAHSRAHTGIEE